MSATIINQSPQTTSNPTTGGDALDNIDLNSLSYFAILFYMLMGAMQVKQQTIVRQTNEISNNANIQQQVNKENGQIHYEVLPDNASDAQIQSVQTKNQEFARQREDYQNTLVILRQSSQQMTTMTSTNVNFLEQDSSMNTQWLKTLGQIFDVINPITKSK